MDQVFTERERQVFPYWNGAAHVWGDPLLIYRKFLKALDGDPNPPLTAMSSDDPAVWMPAVEQLMPAVRQAFDLVPYDPATGTGATEADCLAALAAWQGYLAAKKEQAGS